MRNICCTVRIKLQWRWGLIAPCCVLWGGFVLTDIYSSVWYSLQCGMRSRQQERQRRWAQLEALDASPLHSVPCVCWERLSKRLREIVWVVCTSVCVWYERVPLAWKTWCAYCWFLPMYFIIIITTMILCLPISRFLFDFFVCFTRTSAPAFCNTVCKVLHMDACQHPLNFCHSDCDECSSLVRLKQLTVGNVCVYTGISASYICFPLWQCRHCPELLGQASQQASHLSC